MIELRAGSPSGATWSAFTSWRSRALGGARAASPRRGSPRHAPLSAGDRTARRIAWEGVRLPRVASQVGADALVTTSGMLCRLPGCPVISLLSNPVPFIDRRTFGSWLRRWPSPTRPGMRERSTYQPGTWVSSSGSGERQGGAMGNRPRPLSSRRHARARRCSTSRTFIPTSDTTWSSPRGDACRPRARSSASSATPRWRRLDSSAFARIAADDGVQVDGRVSLDGLVNAYRRARVLVMASERESFSMPVAEALACGVPVIVRDLPSLRETAGPGALVVGGDDPDRWAKAIGRAVHDDSAACVAAGGRPRHARPLSWERFAEEIVRDSLGRVRAAGGREASNSCLEHIRT